MPYESQKQLTPGDLLDEKGMLRQAGYATSLVRRYDRSAIGASGLRIKEWDYYCITCGGVALALTIADNSYMGLDSVSLLDLDAGFQHTWSAMRLLPRGGYLATCSCSHFMPAEQFKKMLLDAARDAGVSLRLIEERRAAPDHPVHMSIPETDYLKFFLLQIV